MENTNNSVATESLFQVCIGQANENIPGYGYVVFETRELADSFIDVMMKGCFYNDEKHGLPELQLIEDIVELGTERNIKSTLLKTIKLGDEETDPVLISDKPEVIFDVNDSDKGNHLVEDKSKAPKVTVVIPHNSLR